MSTVAQLVPPELAEYPPSCKLVWVVLDTFDEEWVPLAVVLEETHLSESTALFALRRLADHGVVEYRDLGHRREYCSNI